MNTTTISNLSACESVKPDDLLLISRKSTSGMYYSYAVKASSIVFEQQPIDELRVYQAAVLEQLTYIATSQQLLLEKIQTYQTKVLTQIAYMSQQISSLSTVTPASTPEPDPELDPEPEAITLTYNFNDPEPEAITLTYNFNDPTT